MKKLLLLAIACLTMYVGFSQDKKAKTPKAKTATSAVHKIYTCPMHPAVLSDKPGKCPECGMSLIEKITYVCPMHPDVVSDKPGKCPKCGMLLKIKSDAPKHKHTDSTHLL
jgi:Cu+-exporting ATPase